MNEVTIRAFESNDPISDKEKATGAIWSDQGYLACADFDGAVYASPQPELDDDDVTVVLTDGRTVIVQSADLY